MICAWLGDSEECPLSRILEDAMAWRDGEERQGVLIHCLTFPSSSMHMLQEMVLECLDLPSRPDR